MIEQGKDKGLNLKRSSEGNLAVTTTHELWGADEIKS